MRAIHAFALLCLAPLHAEAEELSTALQIEIQSAMLSYTDSVLVDGAYTYLDTASDKMTTVYPANIHPFVVAVGGDFFVCSEMIDERGETVTADFLVRMIDETYRVVQMIVDDRESVTAAIKNAGG